MDNTILMKIKKALHLAENAGTDQESNTALKMAQEMMLKHSVSQDDIDSLENSEIIMNVYNPEAKRTPKHTQMIAATLQSHFPVEVLSLSRRKQSRIGVLGRKTDCEYFCVILDSLVKQYTKKLNPLCKNYLCALAEKIGYYKLPDYMEKNYRTKFKSSYLVGFTSGIDEIFKTNEAEKGLIVITPNDVIEKLKEMAPESKSLKIKSEINTAFDCGYDEGINTGRDYKKRRVEA